MTSVPSVDMEAHVVVKKWYRLFLSWLSGKPVPQYLSGKDDKSN